MRLVDMAMGAIFGGGLVGTWLELRHQRSIERNRRRERAAEALAAVMALVEDLSPSQFRFSKPQHPLGGLRQGGAAGQHDGSVPGP